METKEALVNDQVRRSSLQDLKFGRRLRTVKGFSPYQFVSKEGQDEPQRSTLNPLHQMTELNIPEEKEAFAMPNLFRHLSLRRSYTAGEHSSIVVNDALGRRGRGRMVEHNRHKLPC